MRRGWNRARSKPSEQSYETDPYTTEVLGVFADTDEQQLQHAQEQLALTRQYPGRGGRFPEPPPEPEPQPEPPQEHRVGAYPVLPRLSPSQRQKPNYYQQPGPSAQIVRLTPKP